MRSINLFMYWAILIAGVFAVCFFWLIHTHEMVAALMAWATAMWWTWVAMREYIRSH